MKQKENINHSEITAAKIKEYLDNGKFMTTRYRSKNQRPLDEIPAGYTYFGQFIAHDLTFATPRGGNIRTPRLDLDSVYGADPVSEPLYYDQDRGYGRAFFPEGVEKQVQLNRNNQQLFFWLKDLVRIPYCKREKFVALIPDSRNDENIVISQLHLAFQLAHNKYVASLFSNTNLMVDSINETALVKYLSSQLEKFKKEKINTENKDEIDAIAEVIKEIEFALLSTEFREHGYQSNKEKTGAPNNPPRQENTNLDIKLNLQQEIKDTKDRIIELGSFTEKYLEALNYYRQSRQKIVTHFQYLIIEDFLPTLVDKNTLEKIWGINDLGQSKYNLNPNFIFCKKKVEKIPKEFSVAIFRFGHSMIREGYQFFASQNGPQYQEVVEGIFQGKLIKEKLVKFLDWSHFFYTTKSSSSIPAENIDRIIEKPMQRIAGVERDEKGIDIVIRNINRGMETKLPSGQELAIQLQSEDRDSGIKRYLFNDNNNPTNDQILAYLQENTPLWLYILLEAQIEYNGKKLGGLAGRIVAEVLIRIVLDDPNSYLNLPSWKPCLYADGDPDKDNGKYSIINFLRYAGVYDPINGQV